MSAAHSHEQTPTSSGTSTPTPSSSSYISSSLSNAVTGFLRRLSTDPYPEKGNSHPKHSSTFPATSSSSSSGMDGVYPPPYRTASPFQPPPLYPLSLKGYLDSTSASAQLLSRAIAEEIRLLVPPRLQLCEEWNLVYSLEQDGVSLGTLYKKCEDWRGLRNGFVLVVRDGGGALFGAYLTEAPHPSPHYFGTGECFLWRAAILSSNPSFLNLLPPPPSSDTTNLQRSTTIGAAQSTSTSSTNSLAPPTPSPSNCTGTSTPERIRFKAFPYSGVNDYMMLCYPNFLSVGGGNGHYGLWLDDNLEQGISSPCPTFGNEPLSDDGEKFDILGVELWSIGNMM